MSYLRSIHLHKDKSIFKLDELPIERYAESLGLPGAPKVKFLSKEMAKKKKNASHALGRAEPQAAAPKPAAPSESDGLDDESDDDDLSEHSSSEEEDSKPADVPSTKVSTSKFLDLNSLLSTPPL